MSRQSQRPFSWLPLGALECIASVNQGCDDGFVASFFKAGCVIVASVHLGWFVHGVDIGYAQGHGLEDLLVIGTAALYHFLAMIHFLRLSNLMTELSELFESGAFLWIVRATSSSLFCRDQR